MFPRFRSFSIFPVVCAALLAPLLLPFPGPAHAGTAAAPVPAEQTVQQNLKFTLEQADIVSWGVVRSGISIRMNDTKTREFADLTTANVGKPLALYLGPLAVETVKIRGPVASGQIILAGLPLKTKNLVESFLTTPQKKK